MKRAFAVIRMLDPMGHSYPVPFHFGSVEIRPRKYDAPIEKEALEQSQKSFGIIIEQEITAMRIATVVEAKSEEHACAVAQIHFEEVLDVLSHSTTGLEKFSLMNCGCIRDLSTGECTHLKRQRSEGPFISHRVVRDCYPCIDSAQYFISLQDSELKQALKRSYHWSRKARWEMDGQLRLLFRWFAMEAILMLNKDDNIAPRIRWCLGYPNGSFARLVDSKLMAGLKADYTYTSWGNNIASNMNSIRTFRNDSVHSGFRPQDISASNLQKYDQLVSLACPRVQHFVEAALRSGLETPQEFMEYIPLLFNEIIRINDIHNTLLYSLAHPH